MQNLTNLQRDIIHTVRRLPISTTSKIKSTLEEYYETDISKQDIRKNLNAIVEKSILIKHPYNSKQKAYFLSEYGLNQLYDRVQWETDRLPSEMVETPPNL